MTSADGRQIYEALMHLKPDELTEAKWAAKAKVSRSYFQDLKTKGTRPRVDTLEKILSVVHMTPAQFHAMLGEPVTEMPLQNVVEGPAVPYRQRSLPRDVPVLGTAEGGLYDPENGSSGTSVEATSMMPSEIVDYIRRPIGISDRRQVYALFIVGQSMEPRYLDGEPVFVDPNRTPAIGDHVVIQLQESDGADGSRIVRALVKRLERRTADFIELLQYEPRQTFRIPRAQIAAMHRIIPPGELYGI